MWRQPRYEEWWLGIRGEEAMITRAVSLSEDRRTEESLWKPTRRRQRKIRQRGVWRRTVWRKRVHTEDEEQCRGEFPPPNHKKTCNAPGSRDWRVESRSQHAVVWKTLRSERKESPHRRRQDRAESTLSMKYCWSALAVIFTAKVGSGGLSVHQQ